MVPANAPISQGLKHMRETESKGIKKLLQVAFFIVKKGKPLSDFADITELEKQGYPFIELDMKIEMLVGILSCPFHSICLTKM